MNILAIETSCDETAVALVKAAGGLKKPRFRILAELVSSQIAVHRPFGGVVPNLAKREHAKNLPKLLGQILEISNFQFPISKQIPNSKFQTPNSVDLIAVTVSPGLEPALWTGIEFAKTLFRERRRENAEIKLAGTSHIEGHLYSNFLDGRFAPAFPVVSLVASGGHTTLLLMKNLTKTKKIGETRDDAVGEAFDKVARLLGLPYPGGPEIAKIAEKGNPAAVAFPRPMIDQKNYDFSFSGLKTAVLYHLRDNAAQIGEQTKADVAASFQKAAVDVLTAKTIRAAKEFGAKTVTLSGGVAANKLLRDTLKKAVKKELPACRFHVPAPKYCGDNAAMIAVAAYFDFLRGKKRRLIASSTASF